MIKITDVEKVTEETLERDFAEFEKSELGDFHGEEKPAEIAEKEYETGDICPKCKMGRIALMLALVDRAEKDQEPFQAGKEEGDMEECQLNDTIKVCVHACDDCGEIFDKWID